MSTEPEPCPAPESANTSPGASASDAVLDECTRQELRRELLDTRTQVLARGRIRAREALDEVTALADETDQAATSTAQFYGLRLAEKDRKLVALIEHALDKFNDGRYGICEGSDEPIPLARLRLRPWARYSIEYKQLLERDRAMHEDSDE
jgi:DnaK suppressor protein